MNRNINTNSKVLNNRISNILGTGPLAKFQDYLNLMESYLQKEVKKLKVSINREELEEYSKIAGENHREYLGFLMDEHFKEECLLSFDFPQSLRTSLVIQVFSFFEFELKNICIYHSSLKNSLISFNKMKGNSDVAKAKRYLTDKAKVDFRNLNPEWTFIDAFREVRNFFIHNQGAIDSNDAKFLKIKIFAESNNLELKKKGHKDDITTYILTIPDKIFPENVIGNVNLFLNKLINELKI